MLPNSRTLAGVQGYKQRESCDPGALAGSAGFSLCVSKPMQC